MTGIRKLISDYEQHLNEYGIVSNNYKQQKLMDHINKSIIVLLKKIKINQPHFSHSS